MDERRDFEPVDAARVKALEAEVRRLRAVEARMRAVFDQTYQLIGILTPDGIVVDANRRALDFAGTAHADVVGRPFPETPWWSHARALQDQLRQAMAAARHGELVRFEATHVAAGGALHTVDFSVKPIVGPDLEVTYLVCEGRDISDRKAAEEALRASRQMLALVLDTIPVRVFWKDLDLRYLGCNAQFAHDAGLPSPDAILGKSDGELAWHAEAERYRADDRAVIASGVPRIAYEEPQTTAGGAELWLRTSKIPLRDSGDRIVGVLGVYEDITETRNAEKKRLDLELQIQHAQKLESLGVLAGGIAHDFNNLLSVILGNVDLLALTGRDASSPDAGLQAIGTAARRAGDLCRQLLAYSGRGRFMVQPLDVNAIVREAAELLRPSLSKKTRLEIVADPGPAVIEGDATQIRQLLMNLITNASEALGDREGTIALRTSRVVLGEAEVHDDYARTHVRAGDYVVIDVNDTGVGLDDATRARIFEPFFTTKFTGRGLGLAAVLGIVRGHRGAVQVQSVPGAGTRFRVLVPAHAAGAPAAVRPPPPPSPDWRGSGTVLFVDDEPSVREVGTALFRHLGFDVEVAVDGLDGITRYSPERHAFVVLDVTMPRLDGVEAMRALRAADPRAKIILASGYDAAEVQSRLSGIQPDAFLGKPFTLAALERAVRQLLGGGRAPAQAPAT